MSTTKTQTEQDAEKAVIEMIRGIRFGSVEVTIQDGKVVLIERKEKWRPPQR